MEPQRLQALKITALGMTVSADAGSSSLSGTAYYLAPELHTGAAFTVRSDLFSLGVLTYQLLCGDLHRIMTSGWERDIGDPLVAADIARATDVDPARRFASVAEFASRLRDLAGRRLAQQAQEAAEEFARTQHENAEARAATRKKILIGSVAAIGLVGAVALGYQLMNRGTVDATCVKDGSNEVVPDSYCAAGHSSGGGVFIFAGSPYRHQ